MAYVAPRTRALRAKRRSRLSGRQLPPGKDCPPSPPAFWLWFDDYLAAEQRGLLNDALHGEELQMRYKFLVKNFWRPVAAAINSIIGSGRHPYSASPIRPGMINQ